MKRNKIGFFFTSLVFFIAFLFFAIKNVNASTVGGFSMEYSGILTGWAKIIDYKYYNIGQNNINSICSVFYNPDFSGATVSVYVNGTFAGTLVSPYAGGQGCISFDPIGGNGFNGDNYTISFNNSGDTSQYISGIGAAAIATSYLNNISYQGVWLDGVKAYSNYQGNESYRILGFISTAYDDGYLPPNPPIGGNVIFEKEKTCYIGSDCYLTVAGSNVSVNGWKTYLGQDPYCPPIGNHPEYTLASTTITNGYGVLTVPATTTQSIIKYKISSKSSDNSLAECGDATINWELDPQMQELFYNQQKLHAICGDVATSTGTILSDIRFALECGVRASFYWLFTPDQSVTQKITDNFSDLKIRFPFSAYFELTDEIESSFASSTIAQNGFSVPFIRKTSTSTEFFMIPVMSSSSLPNAIGEDNAKMFRDLFTIIIWTSTALIIYITIRK